jgi:hypothetical protein
MRGATPLLFFQLQWRVQGLHIHYGLISYRPGYQHRWLFDEDVYLTMKGEGGAFCVQRRRTRMSR